MSENIITTDALRKEYYETVAVADINLAVGTGEIFGLIGPNGAGKTTTLRMLATTLEPTSGRIFFRDKDIWKRPEKVRAQIGFMPDFFQMYGNLKVYELLKYFGIAHGLSGSELDHRVTEIIGLADLNEKYDSFVKGLSRGMMQRLCLGRSILHRPKLLLLDEPASGLDPLARKNLFDLLKRVHDEGATIIISSHILGELSDLCTSVGIMHNGAFLETGRTDDIIRKIMPKRQIVIQLVTDPAAAAGLLADRPGISEIKVDETRVQFSFDGTDNGLAELNAALVGAGVGVSLLEEGKTSLHELYFAIAERDADAGSS